MFVTQWYVWAIAKSEQATTEATLSELLFTYYTKANIHIIVSLSTYCFTYLLVVSAIMCNHPTQEVQRTYMNSIKHRAHGQPQRTDSLRVWRSYWESRHQEIYGDRVIIQYYVTRPVVLEKKTGHALLNDHELIFFI